MASHDEHDSTEQALVAKVAAWQAALDAYRAAKASDGPIGDVKRGAGATAAANGKPSAGFDLPVWALREHSLPEAIKIYLAAGNRKQTNKEIAIGVRQGGQASNAENLEASVASSLFRMKKAGIVLRFADGWDLAEHYPDHVRKKLEPTTKPAKSRKRTRRAKAESAPTEQKGG